MTIQEEDKDEGDGIIMYGKRIVITTGNKPFKKAGTLRS